MDPRWIGFWTGIALGAFIGGALTIIVGALLTGSRTVDAAARMLDEDDRRDMDERSARAQPVDRRLRVM